MWPWIRLMPGFWAAVWPAGVLGPARLTWAPPAAAFGPFAPFAPVWSVAVGAGALPAVSAGIAFGPVAVAVRLAGQDG